MRCSHCGLWNRDDEQACGACGQPLAVAENASGQRNHRAQAAAAAAGDPAPLESGKISPAVGALTPVPSSSDLTVAHSSSTSGLGLGVRRSPDPVDFGPRYKVEKLLGEGGMGAVYKAQDVQLKRTVALKLIRGGLSDNPTIVERFKQELLLASKVSHKNVLRIHDLGEHEGRQFISMAYVEGEDLHSLLFREGRLPLKRVLSLARQLCAALDAAHAEGVVHRDLKPQNILLDATDHVYVSDFGLAKSLEDDMTAMTRSGETLGTPRYMAPEQVQASTVDHRADLYSLGVILYEMITGDVPFRAKSAIQMMYKTVHEQPKNPQESNPDVPDWFAQLILRCLEKEPDNRYYKAADVLADLEAAVGPSSRVSAVVPAPPPPLPAAATRGKRRLWIGVGAVVAVLVALGIYAVLSPRKAPAGPAISMAIVPFRNASGDAQLDWLGNSLAEMLSTDVGQSDRLHIVSPDRLHQVLRDLHISADSTLDPATVRRLAQFSNADRILTGQYSRFGHHIRIDAALRDLKTDTSIPLKAEAPTEKELLAAVNQLASAIQGNLTLPAQSVKQLRKSAFTPSSQSVDALRFYSEGMELNRQGNNLEALKRFQSSIQADPQFALAYSMLGQTYRTLGYDKEAEQNSGRAVDLGQNLPEREKYLIVASNARILNDFDKAVQAYESLLKLAPEDVQTEYDLARLYESKGVFDRSKEYLQKALQRDPKSVDMLLAMGRVQGKSGNYQEAVDYLNRALSLAVELGNQQGKANILQALGVTYRFLHKPDDALRNFQESLAIKKEIGDKRGIAISLGEIAAVLQMKGKFDEARAQYEQALKMHREIGNKAGIGLTLMNLGVLSIEHSRYDDALKFTKDALQVHQELGDENYQANCLNNLGVILDAKGQYDDAITYYRQALQLQEKLNLPAKIAESYHNLAEAMARLGQYDQALTHYLKALDLARNTGNAKDTAVISHNMGVLFEYQGRYGAALSARGDALKGLEQLKDQTRWMAEVRAGYAHALSLVGKREEAAPQFEQALRLARELKDTPLTTEILDLQGDSAFYVGDFRAARTLYGQALAAAPQAEARGEKLRTRFDQARLAVGEKRYPEALSSLAQVAREADALRLKQIATAASMYQGEALLATRKYTEARAALENAFRQSENLGLRPLQAKAADLLAVLAQATGDTAESSRRASQAKQLLEDMRQEAHSDFLLHREDLRLASASSK